MDEHPNLPEIAAFLAVVERGSFGGAARTLGVAKSSISRRVSALETKLGARLLQRTSRTLALTEVGTAYHARVSAAIGTLRDAALAVHDLQAEPRGHLRVTAPVDLGSMLGRMMAAFCETYGSLTVEMSLTQRTVDLVGEGFDVAIRAGTMPDSSLVARPLGDSVPVLVASPDTLSRLAPPRRPEDLAAAPFVLFSAMQTRPGSGRLRLQGPRGRRTVEVHGPLCGDDFVFVRDAVLGDTGIGLVPLLLCSQDITAGRLVRLLPQWRGGPAPMHVVYPSRELVPAKTRAFRDFAVDWMTRTCPEGAHD